MVACNRDAATFVEAHRLFAFARFREIEMMLQSTIRGVAGTALLVLAISSYAQTPPSRSAPRFPPAAIWNKDISAQTADPASATMIASSIAWGTGGTNFQLDFSMHVLYTSWGNATDTPLLPNSDYYTGECDADTSVPIPAIGAIEARPDYSCDYANNDCHLLIVHGDTLFESYKSAVDTGGLHSSCLVKWHLNLVYPPAGRGDGCTSADAAGFPIAPLLFNPDDVHAAMQSGTTLGHAFRFTLPNSRIRAGYYVYPASHIGAPSGPANAIPYGARLRLKSAFNISGYNAAAQVILKTLKQYGMFLSDGGDIPLIGDDGLFTAHKWDDADIAIGTHSLYQIALGDFEVMPIGTPIAMNDCVRNGFGDDVIFADGMDW